MKKAILTIIAVALTAGVASAADASVGVDFASAYVFRGTTFNDGLVAQPYAEIGGFLPEEYGSLAVGTWANFDIGDYGGTLDGNEFSEIDYYLSYSLPIEAIDVSVGYCEYTYPNGGTADREISLSLGKGIGDSGLYPYFNAYYGVGGGIDGDYYLQAGIGYEVAVSDALSLSVDTAVGYVKDGFNDLTTSVGASYSLTEAMSVGASIAYVADLDVLEADTQLYGMVGVGYDF